MKLIKQHKQLLFDIGLFLLLFFISFVVAFMITSIWDDQIFCYGFSYNISKGLIIYRDFNTLQTPLYFMIASFFIKIFGNYLISTCILDSILAAGIGFTLFKMIGWKGIFPFMFLLVFVPSPYNLMCLFLLLIILYLIHDNKYNDLLVAFIVGLIFITKQNIGVLLFIPMFIYSKKKVKSTLVFIIPFIILCIYFLCYHALFDFFDYVFFSLFEFGGNNYYDMSIVCIWIIGVCYLLYSFYKSKFKDREALYILLFQLVVFPICDIKHFIPALVVLLYYYLKNYKKKIPMVIIGVLEIIYVLYAFYINFIPIDIQMNKDLLYLRSPAKLSNSLNEIYDKFDGKIENVYFDSAFSYLLKIYYGVPIKRFDFFIDGNLGYYSKKEILKELKDHCEKEKCTFILLKDTEKDYQGVQFRDYIKKHYIKVEDYKGREVYSSK